ncbi:MAG: hypothetical protein WDZ40_02630 [Candidatus Spechtbacterales bacterium]
MSRRKSGRKSSGFTPKTPTTSSHHLRPRSRGGADKKDNNDQNGNLRFPGHEANEIRLHNKTKHRPLHDLFNNDRLSEVLAKLLFCWETVNPNVEENEPNTWPERLGFKKRKKAWSILFNPNIKQITATEHLLKEFVHTEEDMQLCVSVLKYALKCNIVNQSDFDRCLNIMKNNGN